MKGPLLRVLISLELIFYVQNITSFKRVHNAKETKSTFHLLSSIMKNSMVPIPAPVWVNDIGILKEFIMEDGAQ